MPSTELWALQQPFANRDVKSPSGTTHEWSDDTQ